MKKVSKKTREKNVRRFSKDAREAWGQLSAFADAHCKKKDRDAFLDDLSKVVDTYVNFNCEMLTWCHRNGVNPCDFVCDVVNRS